MAKASRDSADVDDLTNRLGKLRTGPPERFDGSSGQPRPWSGPGRQSAFVLYFLGHKLYAMRHKNGLFGTPGGRRWDVDDALIVTMKRKISHEVGTEMIPGEYRYFDMLDPSNPNCLVRFYCKTLTRQEADQLPLGRIDNDSSEIEALWLLWEAQLKLDKKKIRVHIEQFLRRYKKQEQTGVPFVLKRKCEDAAASSPIPASENNSE